MTIHDEFLDILGVLLETPEPKKPPSAERNQTSEEMSDASHKPRANVKHEGAGS
jgi:hypothetical protein